MQVRFKGLYARSTRHVKMPMETWTSQVERVTHGAQSRWPQLTVAPSWFQKEVVRSKLFRVGRPMHKCPMKKEIAVLDVGASTKIV